MTKQLWRIGLFILLLLFIIPPLTAQDTVGLTAFINPLFNIQGLRPRSWIEHVPDSGVYQRSGTVTDRTALIIQTGELSVTNTISGIAEQYGLTTLPAPIDHVTTATLSWSIYKIERQLRNQTLHVDIAIAEDNTRLYLVMMQTNQTTYEQLHEQVFHPAVNALRSVTTRADTAQGYGYSIVNEWQVDEGDNITTIHNVDDTVTIYVGTIATDDGEVAINQLIADLYPDNELTYTPGNITLQETSVSRIITIEFKDGSSASKSVLRGRAQVVNGVAYVTILDTTLDALLQYRDALSVFESSFNVDAISQNSPDVESTPDVEVTPDVESTPDVEVTPEVET